MSSDPSVFDYLDYRAFLRDLYAERKRKRGLSYRGFARRAQLKSPNYLKVVIEGKRNLSPQLAERIARAFNLEEDECSFFGELVRLNQAQSVKERKEAYERVSGYRRYQQAQPLQFEHAAYHSTWYLPAIRELAARPDFSEEPEWIANKIRPAITRSQAADAVATLLRLGLLIRNAEGRLVQGDALVSTGPEMHRLYIANYHRTMIQLAVDSIDTIPSSERDISSVTLCLGQDGLRQLKDCIQRIRRELVDLSTLENDPRQVIQVNFQLYPLSVAEEPSEPPPE